MYFERVINFECKSYQTKSGEPQLHNFTFSFLRQMEFFERL